MTVESRVAFLSRSSEKKERLQNVSLVDWGIVTVTMISGKNRHRNFFGFDLTIHVTENRSVTSTGQSFALSADFIGACEVCGARRSI